MNFSTARGTQTPTIPEWLRPSIEPLVAGSTQQQLALQQQVPLTMFGGFDPRGIAGFSSLQEGGLNQIWPLQAINPFILGSAFAQATLPEVAALPVAQPSAEQGQLGLIDQLAGGPVGSSPATQAGMEAWRQYVLPTVQHESAQAGLGRSGAHLNAVAGSATQAAVPLIQQEIANRLSIISVLGEIAGAQTTRGLRPREDVQQALMFQAQQAMGLAQTMFDQQVQSINLALQGGQLVQDQAQALNDAAYAEFERLQSMVERSVYAAFGIAPSTFGLRERRSGMNFGLTK